MTRGAGTGSTEDPGLADVAARLRRLALSHEADRDAIWHRVTAKVADPLADRASGQPVVEPRPLRLRSITTARPRQVFWPLAVAASAALVIVGINLAGRGLGGGPGPAIVGTSSALPAQTGAAPVASTTVSDPPSGTSASPSRNSPAGSHPARSSAATGRPAVTGSAAVPSNAATGSAGAPTPGTHVGPATGPGTGPRTGSATGTATSPATGVAPGPTHDPTTSPAGPIPATGPVTFSMASAASGTKVALGGSATKPWLAVAAAAQGQQDASATFGLGPLQVTGSSATRTDSPFTLAWGAGASAPAGARTRGWLVLAPVAGSGAGTSWLRVPLRPYGPPGTFTVYLATSGGGVRISVAGASQPASFDVGDCGQSLCPMAVTVSIGGSQRVDGNLDLIPLNGATLGLAAVVQD